jgi:hypothetical protein
MSLLALRNARGAKRSRLQMQSTLSPLSSGSGPTQMQVELHVLTRAATKSCVLEMSSSLVSSVATRTLSVFFISFSLKDSLIKFPQDKTLARHLHYHFDCLTNLQLFRFQSRENLTQINDKLLHFDTSVGKVTQEFVRSRIATATDKRTEFNNTPNRGLIIARRQDFRKSLKEGKRPELGEGVFYHNGGDADVESESE